jgi:DNA-binding beta-propeller fold protein YncE
MLINRPRQRVLALAASLNVIALGAAAHAQDAFIPKAITSSTMPANGDVNPYGVAFVPRGFPAGGTIAAGDVLVSNFNNSANSQGTGTTIIQFSPQGQIAPPGEAVAFFISSQAGLSTALGVLHSGFVIVGNVPTTDGTIATIGQGSLQVIDKSGHLVATWTDPVLLDGPWDLTIDDHGSWARVFVSNVLNGTVVRLDIAVQSKGPVLLHKTAIANGYTHVPNMAALILGPTGLAYDRATDTLYVASTNDNAIYAISHASQKSSADGRGQVLFADQHLRGPLALRFAPNGDLLAANGDAVNADPLHPSEIVEFTRSGRFVSESDVDSSQGGAFGLDTVLGEALGDGDRDRDDRAGAAFNYAFIDDVTNSLAVLKVPER